MFVAWLWFLSRLHLVWYLEPNVWLTKSLYFRTSGTQILYIYIYIFADKKKKKKIDHHRAQVITEVMINELINLIFRTKNKDKSPLMLTYTFLNLDLLEGKPLILTKVSVVDPIRKISCFFPSWQRIRIEINIIYTHELYYRGILLQQRSHAIKWVVELQL